MERFYDCLENDCKQLNSIYLVMEQNLTLPEEDSLPVIIDNISTPLQKNLRVGKFPGIHGCYTYFSFPNSVFELHAEVNVNVTLAIFRPQSYYITAFFD